MVGTRGISAMAMLSVILVISSIAFISAISTYCGGEYDPYISSPTNIPMFDGYKTPIIKPGSTGTLSFNITNRYASAMKNITLTLGIYRWATLEDSKPIDEINDPPYFESVNIDNAEISGTEVEMHIELLPSWGNITVSVKIKAHPSTPEGVYFVRAMLVFDYDNTTGIVMKSVGYFPRELWDEATSEPGTLNLTLLNVSGIVPDTSFSVKDPHPLWQSIALGTLVFLIALFLVLAWIFYMIEEQGREFQWMNKLQALAFWRKIGKSGLHGTDRYRDMGENKGPGK